MPRNTLLFLLIIVCLGFLLRFVNLTLYPPSVNWDEASLGYNAFSVLQTGRDEWRQPLPLIFRAFGDYKLPGYVYFDVPFVAFFGLNPLSTRLPSVLSGTLLIFSGFVIAYRLTRSAKLALAAAFVFALAPWSIWLSRIALEGNLALGMFAVGLALSLHPSSKLHRNLGVIFLLSTVLIYNSYRVLIPVWILSLAFFYRHRLKNFFASSLPGLLIGLLIMVPLVLQFFTGVASQRYQWVELITPGAVSAIESARNNSALPTPLAKLVHNRPVYFLSLVGLNYAAHFSPHFLFFKGGSNYQFNIVNQPLLPLVLAPLFYLGLVSLVRKRLPAWLGSLLLLSPLAASLTRDAPHTLRAATFLIPLTLISVGVLPHLPLRRVLYFLFFPLVTISTLIYLFSWRDYRSSYSWAWQVGHAELSRQVAQAYDQVDEVIITKRYGEPHIFILYDLAWSPSNYFSNPHLNRYYRSYWYWVDSFAKFRFVNDWDMPVAISQLDPSKKYLVVTSPDNPAPASDQTINFLDGSPAYYLSRL